MAENLVYRLPNEEYEYTQSQLAEVYRCKNDIVYFAENYCKIITPKGRRNIELYDYQRDFLGDSIDHLRYILKCSRQVGKTTVTTVLISWYLLFSGSDKNIAIVSKDLAGAKEILKRVKITYSELPKWLQRGVVDWNVTNITLDNLTSAVCFPAGSEQLRGFTVNFLYLDEFAILKKNVANDFIDTVMPTIANDPDARIVITSTPKGMNQFYDMYKIAKDFVPVHERKDFYKRTTVKWSDIPGRDAKWKAKVLRDLKGDEDRFRQEYDTEFELASSSSYFRTINLEEKQFVSVFDKRKNVICRVWEKPPILRSQKMIEQDRYYYVAGVDISEGVEGDSTVCTCFKIDKAELKWTQIARFTTNVVDPKDVHHDLHYIFSDLMNRRINKIFMENNSFGREVINNLIDDYPDEEYYEIIYRGKVGEGDNAKTKLGVQTNKKTKPENVRQLKYLLDKGNFILRDGYTATEFGKFIKDGTKFYGSDGHPDDEVMSCVLTMELLNTNEYIEFVNKKKQGENNYIDKYDDDKDDEPETTYIFVNGRRKRLKHNSLSKYATN